MRYWLWAIPRGKMDRLDERPLTSIALTPKEALRVRKAATRDGWHNFRIVPDTQDAPNFAGAASDCMYED